MQRVQMGHFAGRGLQGFSVLGQNHTIRIARLNHQGSFSAVASQNLLKIIFGRQFVAKQGRHLGRIRCLLEQVGGMFLCILQDEAFETTLGGSFHNDTRPERKAKSYDGHSWTIGLHEVVQSYNGIDELVQILKVVVIQSLHIGKTNAILLSLGHEIGSINRTFKIIADSAHVQNLHCRTHIDVNARLQWPTVLHNGSAMTKMLKFPNIHRFLYITLLCKHIKQILHKRPNVPTSQFGIHLFNSRKHDRHKL
jgi:hypothetical protein